MKRIQAIDILRGVAMLGLVFFHAFEKVAYNSVVAQIFSYPLYILIPLGLLIYFVSWRGFFLIISGIGNAYGFQKAIEKGKSPHIQLLNRLLWSIVLFFHALAIQVFWNPYYGLYNVFLGVTGPSVWYLPGLQFSDAVEIIAIGVALSSIIQYFFTLGKMRFNPWIPIIAFGILMSIIYGVTPLLTEFFISKFGWSSVRVILYQPVNNFGDRVRWLSFALLIGEQEPLFPHLATFFLGSGIGIALTNPKITKKNTILTGYSIGFLFIAVALLLGGLKENFYVDFSIIPSLWFLLLGIGLQVWVITSFLWIFDFAKKAQKRTKFTKTIRRAGIITLTIFTLQSLDFFPRWVLTKISTLVGSGINYINNSQGLELGNAILMSFTVLIFWIGLIFLWGLINYAFSFDWIFEIFRRLTAGQKINWKDPLQSREIIFKTESVFNSSNEILSRDY